MFIKIWNLMILKANELFMVPQVIIQNEKSFTKIVYQQYERY